MSTFGWRYTGTERPPFAREPGPGQESVWDYPRPPRLERDRRTILIRHGATIVAESSAAVRVLETASPPTFYLPPDDVRADLLEPRPGRSHCEWKGTARYWDVITAGGRVPRAAWSYPDPLPAFREIAGWLSFYPAALECLVDGERARPQGSGFYGGWVTREIAGPWKGEPGTGGW